jgi:hypothetical protein
MIECVSDITSFLLSFHFFDIVFVGMNLEDPTLTLPSKFRRKVFKMAKWEDDELK